MQIIETHKLPMIVSNDTVETVGQTARFLSRSSLTPLGNRQRPSRIGGIQFGSLSFALIEFGTPMRVEAAIEDDYYIIMACLRGSAELEVDGQKIELVEGRGFLARPCHSIIGRFSGDCVRLMVRIDPDILRAVGYPELDERYSPVDVRMKPWFDQVELMLSSPAIMHRIVEDAQVRIEMEKLLFALLRSGGLLQPREVRSRVASRDVRRADVFIREHAQDAICLDDIVNVSGVSARALQNNFMRFHQTSPMQYLRHVRLELVHERLLASAGSALISSVALENGFNHLGRFSVFYRGKYGESPSETLRRARDERAATRKLQNSRLGTDGLRRPRHRAN